MKGFLLELLGDDALTIALARQSAKDFQRVQRKNILAMRNRAVKTQNPAQGGTPVGDYKGAGELRLGASVSSDGETFGYVAHYAPHVEYGHRLVEGGVTIGFVPGQYFLRTNVQIQKPLFRQDLLKELRK